MDYREEFYSARWHIDVANRMFESYGEYGGKRFLIGIIREGAQATGKLVRAFLIREKVRGDLKTFINNVAPLYLDASTVKDLVAILNLERDQKLARVEFKKGNEILFEINGRWSILKVSRLKKFIESIGRAISSFPTDIKR